MSALAEIPKNYLDHFWQQFQIARASGDHSDEYIFKETLKSFARCTDLIKISQAPASSTDAPDEKPPEGGLG